MAAGRVEQILIAAHAGELPHPVERVRAVAGAGPEGDRYFAGVGTWSDCPVPEGKALTLVEAEVLEELGLPPVEARRNLVTRGVRLNELVGGRFRVGAVECRGDWLAEPYRYLADLTGVPVAAPARRLPRHRRDLRPGPAGSRPLRPGVGPEFGAGVAGHAVRSCVWVSVDVCPRRALRVGRISCLRYRGAPV